MAGEIAAEWIKIPDGNGGFNKVWVRDSTARRSIAQLQTEIADLSAADVGAIPLAQKGAASGVAELDANGLVPSSQLPSYVDDVLEYASSASFPAAGESGKIYVDLGTNLTYRWSGSAYVEISPSLALGATSSTAFRGDHGNTAYEHAVNKGSAFASGLYKITTNAEGHVTGATAVAKPDITSLGIPGAVPDPSSVAPAMDGTAAAGSSADYSRADHVHPHDTSKADKATTLAGYGITNAYTKAQVDDMIPSVPSAYTSNPEMDGTASAGSSMAWARGDHVHPSDTAKQDALTSAQMDAVNSGITAAKVTNIQTVTTGGFAVNSANYIDSVSGSWVRIGNVVIFSLSYTMKAAVSSGLANAISGFPTPSEGAVTVIAKIQRSDTTLRYIVVESDKGGLLGAHTSGATYHASGAYIAQ